MPRPVKLGADTKYQNQLIDKFITGSRTKALTTHVFQKLEDYSRTRHSNIVTVFRDVDKDQSGSLSAPEMKKTLTGWGIPLHDDEHAALIKTFDQDGDGEISFGEMFDAINAYKSDKRRGGGDSVCSNVHESNGPFNPRDMTQRYTPGFHNSHIKRLGPPRLPRNRKEAEQMMLQLRARKIGKQRDLSRFVRTPGSKRSESCLGTYPGMRNSKFEVLPPIHQATRQPCGESFKIYQRQLPHHLPGR